MVHIVYCDNSGRSDERVLDKILAGKKTMIVRGSAGQKIPHSRVFAGETLYFIEKGSLSVSATATVTDVKNHTKLNDSEINAVFDENKAKLNLSDKQRVRWHKKCLCLIEFSGVRPIIPSLPFDKQTNMDDWLIVKRVEDIILGTSIPYNYDNSRF